MDKKVYILTREGSRYSTEGLLFLTEKIKEIHHDTSNLEFIMGQFLNDPEMLIRELSKNKGHCYLALSHQSGVYISPSNEIDEIIRIIKDHKPGNTWEMCYRVYLQNQQKA